MTTEAGSSPPAERKSTTPFVQRSVEDMAEMERQHQEAAPTSAIVADRIVRVAGTIPFVVAHVAWFGIWIAVNTAFGDGALDPYPFSFLTFMVSLEAIFLAIFVLINQNQQAALADRRTKVDLQLNAIAEHELTKLIELVTEIHDHIGLDRGHDEELREMQEKTRVEQLVNAIEEQESDDDPDPKS